MPLVPATIAELLKAKLLANPDSGAVAGVALDALCLAIAQTIQESMLTATVITTCGVGPGTAVIT